MYAQEYWNIYHAGGYHQKQRLIHENALMCEESRATRSRSPTSAPCRLAPGLQLQPSVCLHSHTYMRWGGSDPESMSKYLQWAI